MIAILWELEYDVLRVESRRPVGQVPITMGFPYWMSDVMHGPKIQVGHTRRKSYLVAFIDNAAVWIMPRPWPEPLRARTDGRNTSA